MMGDVRFDLSGKVAVVTGGGKGIGRAIALGLASAGASVVVAARTEGEIEAVAGESGPEAAGPAGGHRSDGERPVGSSGAGHPRHFGGVSISWSTMRKEFSSKSLDLREDGWDKVFDTNVKAVWLLSRLVARQMIEQKDGRIINITTVGAEKAELGMAAYGCSKAALKMLPAAWPGMGRLRHSGQRRRADSDADGIQPAHLVQSGGGQACLFLHSHGAPGRAGGDGRRGPLPGLRCCRFCDGPVLYVDGGSLTRREGLCR